MKISISTIFLLVFIAVVLQMASMYQGSVPDGTIGWIFPSPNCEDSVKATPAFFVTIIAVVCFALSNVAIEKTYFTWVRFVWGLIYLVLSGFLVVAQLTAFIEAGCADDISFISKLLVSLVTLMCIGSALVYLESKFFTVVFFLLSVILMIWLTATFGVEDEELSFAGYFYQLLYALALLAGGISGLASVSIREAAREMVDDGA